MSDTTESHLQVRLELDCDHTINFAMQQNDVPVVRQIRVTNLGTLPLEGVQVRLTSEPELFPAWQTTVTTIAPGGTYTLGPIDLRLSANLLMGLTERVSGCIHAEVVRGAESLCRHAEPIEMLAFDEWNGLARSLPELLAAYVLPNHPLVEEILSDAAKWLGSNTGDSALSGYQTRSAKRVGEIAQAVYKAIQARGIRYCNPPASFESTGQKVRLPDRILENRLATCLDLAVLAAACLEQAGLHPLVIFIEGHAFVGIWTSEDCFPDCATDDPLRIRKRVDLNEILVFETTLVTAPPPNDFVTAVVAGKRHLEDEQAFQCAIDIHRCRKSRVRPLPTRRAGDAAIDATTSAHLDTDDAVFELDSTTVLASQKQPETPTTRLDRWKRKLLDLTLHNKLINFKETKSTVPLLCPTLGSLEDSLADGLEFQILARPQEFAPGTARSAELHRLRTGADATGQLLLSEFESRRLRADLPEQDLNSRLTGIYRAARTAMEEGGASALYLALGFLAWYETDTSEQRRLAPIILIPVEVHRHSVQEGYRICQADEEPRINITLLEMLVQDFDLRLPNLDPIPEDDHGIDVKGILTTFRQAIKDMRRWDVVEEAQVGFFSFTKFLMWRDLEERSEDLLTSRVVDHLVNHPNEPFPDDGGFPEEGTLDEKYQPQDTFCPLPADSSQLAAVYAASEGKTFVLFGPPGTGKSQTITNLIAHSLAAGKSVLFVSEKMAALNVVYNRLSQSGLGPFCLELHSNKTHKRHVIEQLGQALDFRTSRSSEEWEQSARQMAGLRADLNGYVQALHQRRGFGESVFQATSRLIGLRQAPFLDLKLRSPEAVTREQLQRWRDLIERLRNASEITGHPDDNAWSACGIEAWSAALQRDVESDLQSLQRHCEQLGAHVERLGPLLGEGTNWNLEQFGFAETFTRFLTQAPRVPVGLLLETDWESATSAITQWIAHGRQRDALRQALYQRYQEQVLTLDLEGLASQLRDSRASWSQLRAASGNALSAAEVETWSTTMQRDLEPDLLRLQELCGALESHAHKIGPLLGIGAAWNLSYFEFAEKFVRFLTTGPRPSASLLLEADWESAESSINDWVAHGRKRDSLRQSLYTRYETRLLDLDIDGLSQRLKKAMASWFLPRWLGVRAVRKTLAQALRNPEAPNAAVMVQDLVQATSLREEGKRLTDAGERARQLLGPYWKDSEADWNAIEALRDWSGRFRKFSVAITGSNFEKAAAIRRHWTPLVTEGYESLQPEGELGQAMASFLSAYTEFTQIKANIESRLAAGGTIWGPEAKRVTLADIRAKLASWLGVRAVRMTLAQVLRSSEQTDAATMAQDLTQAVDLRDRQKALADAGERARQLLGQYWNDSEADWDAVDAARTWATQFRKYALDIADADLQKAAAIRGHWAPLVTEQYASLQPQGELGRPIADYLSVYAQFVEVKASIESRLVGGSSLWAAEGSRATLPDICTRMNAWKSNMHGLRAWCNWRQIRREAVEAGLQPLVAAYESGGVSIGQLRNAFDRSFYQWWVESVTETDPVLQRFFSAEHERKIRQFREIDERFTQLTRSEIQARLAGQRPANGGRVSESSEVGILNRQRQLRRGHMPVRQLFQKIPQLLSRLKPCLLMSPISVSQYLDACHPPFDLVVFDEASQIPVWDSVGAIARGKEAIIVGDPKQLPPTSFFMRADEQEVTDDTVVEEMESILDECLSARLPQMPLRWHYRSRHESLIAFSNYHYYDNSLLTFPSPWVGMGVSYRHVPGGTYDKGRSRTNRAEAEAVVQEVLCRLKDPQLSRLSIGIVTFSTAQQVLVEDLLDEARSVHPEIEPFFGEDAVEPVFIKNLENVQGDERDVILFSICYGPDATGRVSMNFGPLNRDGGERRLNVAVTRARAEVIVFATLKAEQIDPSRTRARGAQDLKCFLDYAERGPVALSQSLTLRGGAEFDSPFEQDVCHKLRAKGYEVHTQVGCSGYRIDLAVVDPKAPGRYLLGIECDGANYHSAKTARDRDRLRESILVGLGWRIHRVWGSDWWTDPDGCMAKIEAAIEQAKLAPVAVPPPPPKELPVQPALPPEPADEPASLTATAALPQYRAYQPKGRGGSPQDFYMPSATGEIARLIDEMVRQEGPVALETVYRRIASFWGLGRVGSTIRERIEGIARRAGAKRVKHGQSVFLWPQDSDPVVYCSFRVPGVHENEQRDIDEIPPEEIAAAAIYALRQQVSLPMADLVRETALVLGFQRTGQTIQRIVQAAIKPSLKKGSIQQDDAGRVSLA